MLDQVTQHGDFGHDEGAHPGQRTVLCGRYAPACARTRASSIHRWGEIASISGIAPRRAHSAPCSQAVTWPRWRRFSFPKRLWTCDLAVARLMFSSRAISLLARPEP